VALDLTRLGELAAELMEALEDEHGEEARLGVVAVVVEVTGADDEWTAVQYRCSDPRRWIQSGLFAAAGRAVIDSSEDVDEDT
jgi:hypothetical protein